jgi:cobalamin-dependent methionine synthase I
MTMAQFTSDTGVNDVFGYPACPDLEVKWGLWKLLKPEEIGVELPGFMMDPRPV